jgi:hypothetical protein
LKITTTPFHFPRILHLYWNGPLPFLNYLTVISFNSLHPNWQINIYVTNACQEAPTWESHEQTHEIQCRDYFDDLRDIGNVNIVDITDACIEHNIAILNRVHQSDWIRVFYLLRTGGVWSDFDILYTHNLERILGRHKNDIIFLGTDHYGYRYCPVGLLLSKGEQPLYRDIHQLQQRTLNDLNALPPPVHYQMFSVDCFNHLLCVNDDEKRDPIAKKYNLTYVEAHHYLPYPWYELNRLYDRTDTTRITEDTIGVHRFKGATRSRENHNRLEKKAHKNKTNKS